MLARLAAQLGGFHHRHPAAEIAVLDRLHDTCPGAIMVGDSTQAISAGKLCLIGDGGLMFSPGELLTAVEENLYITLIVFNNEGYGEIASAMKAAGAQVLGCTPRPLQSPRRNPGPA